ncbi:uncharacterized protein LOC112081926 [Eutrema salsugineum]|uniref:uncharacterized protein LOC112081926 n=1 Tax=Eutrema salsugineum TaxID=72664 RepID=UPI000CED5F7C|nr:uncharacterized protein LOC112081926 [Eutrema salsugineum]
MDKALMAMSLEEEDVPFDMMDLPEYSSCERNVFSVIGRLLNPDCQKMASLILDMPRKWQKYDRARGVALSKEKFQFIFSSENDLDEILMKGFQTFNEWGLAIKRWENTPPVDYLQFVLLWVQLRNILVNHYTVEAIMTFGDVVGQVIEVAFDPKKSQSRGFVRVKILFDVSKPLRKSKVFNLPRGAGQANIEYFYEKVQKRCYSCQRLTHDQSVCPILVKIRQDQAISRRMDKVFDKPIPEPVLKKSDPLFGVLEKSQVGIQPVLGRPRIAPEVLEGMRQYLLVAEGEERKIREERVKRTVFEAESSSASQKSILRLEPPPIISRDPMKGKGLVFGYGSDDSSTQSERIIPHGPKLLSAAIQAAAPSVRKPRNSDMQDESSAVNVFGDSSPFQDGSTGYKIGLFEASPSGTKLKGSNPRKRPGKNIRRFKGSVNGGFNGAGSKKEGLEIGVIEKKKTQRKVGRSTQSCKAKYS